MNSFQEELLKLKERYPEMSGAVDNIIIDNSSPDNPFGISSQLGECLDQEIKDGQPLEQTIRDHTTIRRPDLHTEADVGAEHIKRVMSKQTFTRWHLGQGERTSDFTSASDMAWTPLQDIIEPGEEDHEGNIVGKQRYEPVQLKGTTGRKDAPVWWSWSEDDKIYPRKGKQYTEELALSDNEILNAELDGIVVEVSLSTGKHPATLYRPTGLDSFSPDTRFYPNLNPRECFGRTRPIPPARLTNSHPEAVSAALEYADQLTEDTLIEVIYIKY